MKTNTTYSPDGTMQLTCKGLSKKGELVWISIPKAAWHLMMFPNRYKGDFKDQWMMVSILNDGFDFEQYYDEEGMMIGKGAQ